MKKRKSGKSLACFALFFSVALAAGAYGGASADGVWETVCRSEDIPIAGFFADDVDSAADGSLYLVDSQLRQVVQYRGGAAKTLLNDTAEGYASLCLSPDDSALYVLGTDAAAVTEYALDTGDIFVTPLPDVQAAVDIALSPNGDVYVTDYTAGRIVISRADGTAAVFAGTGGAGEMTGPCGIDINAYGKMAVALYDRAQVVYTRPSDEKLMATDTSGAPGGAIQQLIWTAIDDENNVYLLDSETSRLLVLDTASGAYTALYPAGSGESIRGICTTGNHLYAAIGADDYTAFRIDRCAIGNQLISFGFAGIDAAADIDTAHDTVDITVPPDADLSVLTPVIAAQEGAAVALESTDFTAPVTCTVSSGVLGARSYTITVHQDAALVGADVLAQANVVPDGTDTGGADSTGTTETLALPGDMTAGTDMIVFILLAAAYIALLILGIVLMIVRRKRRRLWILLTAAWVAVGAVLAVVSLALTRDTYDAVYVENAAYDTQDDARYPLSDDQNAAIAGHGAPDGFVMLYVEGIRQETWFYYGDGLVIDFLGGVQTGRGTDAALAQCGAAGAAYRPDMFAEGMTPGTALFAAGIDSFVVEPMDDALVSGGALYYADGIVLGFVDDALCYVETIAAEDEI